MPNISQVVEDFLAVDESEYTQQKGNIMYLNDAGIKRPQRMPLQHKLIALALVAVGVVIGIVFLNNTVYETARQAALAQQSVETNLSREPSLSSLPVLSEIANAPDADIIANLEGRGYTIYNATTERNAGINIYKIPSDMSLSDAELLYARGVSSLNAAQASRLLNGSWNLGTSRESAYTIVVRYADFKATSVDSAIASALKQQNIDPNSSEESGVDDSGNHFQRGTLQANGLSYTWRISAIDLKDVYDITGLPDQGAYVGIRLTQIIY